MALQLEEALRNAALVGSTDTPAHHSLRAKMRELYLSVALRKDINHVPSKSKAAKMLAYFLGGPRDVKLHRELLEEAAEAGDIEALCMRAENYWFGENGYEKDVEKCLADAKASYEGGYWGGATIYGWVLRLKASETKNDSLLALADSVCKETFPKLLADAKAGDNIAQDWLAWRYVNGEGIHKDVECGAAWFRISADNGLPWAMHWLGMMYRDGNGVVQSIPCARQWVEKAARHGVSDAENLLKEL